VEKRISKKREGFRKTFSVVLFLAVYGFVFATIINLYPPLPGIATKIITGVSISIIAWSVLSRLGYETETMQGNTLLEKTSLNSFKLFYCLGIFLLVSSLFVK